MFGDHNVDAFAFQAQQCLFILDHHASFSLFVDRNDLLATSWIIEQIPKPCRCDLVQDPSRQVSQVMDRGIIVHVDQCQSILTFQR